MRPDPSDPAWCPHPGPLRAEWPPSMHRAVDISPSASTITAPPLINPSHSWHSGQQMRNRAAADHSSLLNSERTTETPSSDSTSPAPTVTDSNLERAQFYSPRPHGPYTSSASSARRALASSLLTRYVRQASPPDLPPAEGEYVKGRPVAQRSGSGPDSGSDDTSGSSVSATERRTSDPSDPEAGLDNETRSSSEDGGVSTSSDQRSCSLFSTSTSASVSTAATSSDANTSQSPCSFWPAPNHLLHSTKQLHRSPAAEPCTASQSPAGPHKQNTLPLKCSVHHRPDQRPSRTQRPNVGNPSGLPSPATTGSHGASLPSHSSAQSTTRKVHLAPSSLSQSESDKLDGAQGPPPRHKTGLRGGGGGGGGSAPQSPAGGVDAQTSSAVTQSSLSSPRAQPGQRARSESMDFSSRAGKTETSPPPPPPPPPAGRPPGPGATGNGSRSGSASGSGAGSGSGSGSGSGGRGDLNDSEGMDLEGETEEEEEEPSPEPAPPQQWSEDCPADDMEDMPSDFMDGTTAAQLAYAYQPHDVYIHPHAYLHPHPVDQSLPGPGETSWTNTAQEGNVRYTLRPPHPMDFASLPGGAHFTAADAVLWFGSELREDQYELSLAPLFSASDPTPAEWVAQRAMQQRQCATASNRDEPLGGSEGRRYFVLWPQCRPGQSGSSASVPPSELEWTNRLLPSVAHLEPEWTEWDWGT